MDAVMITLVYIIRICLLCQQRGVDLGDNGKKISLRNRGGGRRERGKKDVKNKTVEESWKDKR